MPMTADQLIAVLEAPPEVGDPLVGLIERLAESPASDITRLRYGQTASVEGWATEGEYLASQRRPQPMRMRDIAGRNSWRRWSPYVGTVGAILERKDRSWRGNGAARRQYARATAARTWYGVPNIILGS